MISQEEFFKKYNIKSEEFEKTELDWKELSKIYEDFKIYRKELEQTAILLFNKLMLAENIHSVRYRIKDSEHLVEKIIRNKIKDDTYNVTFENYKEVVTDLIGLRALHLFKEDWIKVNTFITETWNLKQKPIANFRRGDAETLTNFFVENGCEQKEHPYGYRSIHYIVESQPGKNKHFAEIQVRTIYEEAWAEIDHEIRYPYNLDNTIYSQFLLILNRLSGSADEMGSFILLLKNKIETKNIEYNNTINEKDKTILELERKIEQLNIDKKQKDEFKEKLFMFDISL